ncbi:interferon-activable protein [Parasponia andersonii]|uniref:Interferon-activable protein n=1 Tax=Parasponia andersonii TaxID=3476 RepID=A0A2P5AX68_PARAD|nr:interferon-activable protein [Parasponia andersonii]
MEPAKIDWKNLDSRYVEDELYEHINAPKWFDFLSPNDNLVDDDAWFCRPGCNHPKTAQDFLKSTPSKLASPAGVSEISPLGDRSQREAKLKRRGLAHAWISPNSNSKFNEDGENQDPNLSTPSNNYAKIIKAAIKSSTEKKEAIEDPLQRNNEALPRLKSTLSARNLFAGRDILNQITEFCNELKRMATKTRERDSSRKSAESVKQNVVGEKSKGGALGELDWRGNERKPLLDGVKEKPQEMESNILKEKPRRKKRTDDAENTPIAVNLVLENVKRKGDDNLLQIRTNPPSPQCFSATRGGAPSKLSRSKLMERGILQEQNKQVVVVAKESIDKNKSVSMVDAREEARTLDVFWFLKPCTLSTYNA